MFNPKENLLDQQLAVSGLEMQFFKDLITTGAYSRNKKAKKNEKNAKKQQKKIAKIHNQHNKKLDEADKANYQAMRDFTHETNVRNWERGKEIQDYQYTAQLNQYYKSQAIGQQQLRLNEQARDIAIEGERAAINEAFIQQNFQHQESMSALRQAYAEQGINRAEQNIQLAGINSRQQFGAMSIENELKQQREQTGLQKESAMVDSLVAQGTAQLGQAGKSTAKAQQANMASLHRSLMALDTELSGRKVTAAIQMAELNADASLSKMGVGLNLKRIENAIADAESAAQGNIEVLNANMQSLMTQAERNVQQIELERSVSDANTRAAMMIKPQRLSYDPEPELPPERIFVDRMEMIPGFVPSAQQENLWSAGIKTVASVVSTVATGVGAINAVGQAGGLGSMMGNAFGTGTQAAASATTNVAASAATKLTNPINYLGNSPANFVGGTPFKFP
jgi:hypothetical protein